MSEKQRCKQNEDGVLCVANPSAWYIPKFTITRTIKGTVYRVTGTYDGQEFLDRKIERILSREMEDSE